MSQLNAFALSKAIRNRLVEFSLDRCFVRQPELTEICRKLWSGPADSGGLVSDLWVEGAFPSKTADETLGDLANRKEFDGGLQDHLNARGVIPRDRKLYLHQRDAILEAQKPLPGGGRPALVITAGTGAGKTESFLLPMLNDLFRYREAGKSGVRCIILYPMNALVNDQVDRVHEWLKDQDEVRLFHFTSETPEDGARANHDGVPRWEQETFRVRTRQEARGLETHEGRPIDPTRKSRGGVPDILITNYSMLEYMLCRPQDAVFFGDALRTVILDEAHLYTGTLAAEITLLLRRLMQRCGVRSENVLHIATSATIGAGQEGELEQFAGKLFSKPKDLVKVIRGQIQPAILPAADPAPVSITVAAINERRWLAGATQSADGKALQIDEEQCRALCEDLSLLVGSETIDEARWKAGDQPAALLYHTLGRSELLHRAKQIIEENLRLPLRDFARRLFGAEDDEALRATISLLQMGAAARPAAGAYPLLPHRLHVLARPTDGLVVCLNSNCSGEEQLKQNGLGCVIASFSDHCPYCQSATLSLCRCANCGEAALAGLDAGRRLTPAQKLDDKTRYFTTRNAPKAKRIYLDPQSGEIRGAGYDGLEIFALDACLNCDPDGRAGNIEWRLFNAPAQLTLSILAETALAGLPELPEQYSPWLPARGRRMLAFSDSRQEAARLGPRLRLQHEIQLVRAALARCAMQRPASDESTLMFWRRLIAQLETQISTAPDSPALRQTLAAQLDQARQALKDAEQGGSVQSWLELLKSEKGLQELLHAETSHKHRAENWRHTAKRAWDENFDGLSGELIRLIGRELARAPLRREFSLETLGLLEVCYPGLDRLRLPDHIAGLLPALTRETLASVWPDFLAALCDSLRTDGVITLGGAKEDDDFQFGGIFIGRWCSEEKRRGNRLLSFIGVRENHRRRQFAQTILERCGLDAERAVQLTPDLLRAAFQFLKAHAGETLQWIKKDIEPTRDAPVEALQIQFPALALRRPLKLYRCEQTGHIWPRSVMGCAPESLNGDLRPVTDDYLDRDPRVGRQRSELKKSEIFGLALWAEEHSAQLAPAENRRLQDLFKIGARNILSSTTTLELGIDIGGLNAVLMSNVPPGKANYLQRAGRAGRRADGSSVVITFVRPRPFDREVFARFGDYLNRSYRRPQIFLDRQRVVRRHGNAFLLGEFFRQIYPPGAHVGAMKAFGNMGNFCGVEFIPYWDRTGPKPELASPKPDWKTRPDAAWFNPERNEAGLENYFLDFLQSLESSDDNGYLAALGALFEDSPLMDEVEDWPGFIHQLRQSFINAVGDWRNDYEGLLLAWREIEPGGQVARQGSPRAQANMLYHQSRALYETTVIEAFADRQFLPRYGFPIGLQKLRVICPDEQKPNRIREEDQYRLERAGLLALREYAPGSQLLVGGKLITSRGLLKHWTGAELNNYIGLRGSYTQCQNNHTYYCIASQLSDCPICGAEAATTARALLLPKHGFTSAAWDPPRLGADVERVGTVERATVTFAKGAGKADLSEDQFAGVSGLSVRYREAGEILVYNAGDQGKGFAICLQCGFADSEREIAPQDLPSGFNQHARMTAVSDRYPCWGRDYTPPLRNQTLAAREITDVLLLTFTTGFGVHKRDADLIHTLGFALQIAGAKLLELDTRELGVMVASAEEFNEVQGAVLYDNVPGGAGHVRELFAKKREWLEEALAVLFVNDAHDARCETACLDCLLTFDAQEAMHRGLLQRRKAHRLLKALLINGGDAMPPDAQQRSNSTSDHFYTDEQEETGARDADARLARGQARLRHQRNQRPN